MAVYLTVKQTAEEYFGGGVMQVYRRIWSGEIKTTNVALEDAKKPSFRIARASVEKYFKDREMAVPKRSLST